MNTPSTPIYHGGAKAWAAWCIAVAFVSYYFSFQTTYSIVNASVQKDVGLSISQVGHIAAIYTWVMAACQFVSGPLLDRLGARRVLLPAIGLVTLGVLTFANARSYGMLLLAQTLVALGSCSGFVGAGYIGGTWFGWDRFSFMFGLVQFTSSLLAVLSQNLLTWALPVLHWRPLFNGAAAGGALLLGVAILWLRDAQPIRTPSGHATVTLLQGVSRSLARVARVPHAWAAAIFGALCFGVLLSLGVVWGPKLMTIRGFGGESANLASSLLWLGSAVGSFIFPWVSDRMRRRKLPILIGLVVQLCTLALLLYVPTASRAFDMVLCFVFGLGNAVHMLAFSTAADVVAKEYIGTSAALVSGIMSVVAGLMISRPGMRAASGLEQGVAPASLALAQFAARPLMAGLCLALIIALLMRETYPASRN
ncbi:MFS transporter [Dyella amyloliquefaciens]|uniref:MFS transporter n=1 Tax=Dyella amyloliquefaciens TaxID=1770545 RepID=UPI0013EE5D13|nr:MFS transporter [Dyella amyloliquefaciens]